MSKYNTDSIKAANNIVDVISRFVSLKKQGQNHSACCPFHSEKTPSFTVSEQKQMYYCFGCGASGDVIKFVQDYQGCEFIDACKILGGDIDIDSIEHIKRVEQAQRIRYNLPPDHKEDSEFCASVIEKSMLPIYPIHSTENRLVNAYVDDDNSYFVAGGPSYNGFTQLTTRQDSNRYVICTTQHDANKLREIYSGNIGIAWTCGVKKYLCMWNFGKYELMPFINPGDDDWICYHKPFLTIENNKLKKNEPIA